jgi:hypothetical protein
LIVLKLSRSTKKTVSVSPRLTRASASFTFSPNALRFGRFKLVVSCEIVASMRFRSVMSS